VASFEDTVLEPRKGEKARKHWGVRRVSFVWIEDVNSSWFEGK